MKKIKLTRGKVTTVDDSDYKYLNQWKWFASKNQAGNWYAVRNDNSREKQKIIHMHRAILKTPKGKDTDHIDGNGLDNRRCNLRVVTNQQNRWNQRLHINNSSGYKGVAWRGDCKKWIAYIIYNRKKYHLGYFEDKRQGALVYNVAAKYLYGEFAKLNELGGR